MILTIDTSEPISDADFTVLAALVSTASMTPIRGEEAEKEALLRKLVKQKEAELAAMKEPEPEAEEKPKRTRRTKAEMEAARAAEAEEAESPTDDESEDVDDPSEDAGEYTLADAVARATELLSAGKAAAVKSALAEVGAKRVGDLKPASLGAFMKALG